MKERIAAVIPAFQAEPWIGQVASLTLEIVPDVLVVSDGSVDGTADRARETGAEVMALPFNQGKGAALRHAFDSLFQRGFEAVVTLDADGQHVPGDIPKLIDAWRHGADLVLGSREHAFAEMCRLRRTSNWTSSRLISVAAGRRIADVQTGFRIYSRNLIEATGFPESRFDAESAVVVRAARLGFRIAAVPISLKYTDGRATSHYRPFVDSVRIARAVMRARLEFLPGRKRYREQRRPYGQGVQ
jgi:glycosyltransferase involved in cell wall biosynthesis